MLKRVLWSSLTILGLSLFGNQPAQAEMLNLGQSSAGQSIILDTNSIQRNGRSDTWWSGFTYYLGGEELRANAHCGNRTWDVEGQTYSPQSQATRNMINIVCSARMIKEQEDTGWVLVFDPPSNIRSSPGGSVICTIENMQVISIYAESNNGWYLVFNSPCGNRGRAWIHESQFRAFR